MDGRMSEAPIYKKSPITEAVIDFRVELPDDVLLPTLATANTGQEAEYPVGQELLSLGGEISIGVSTAGMISSTPIGYLFNSSDQKRIYQARLNGFTFSRLAPYELWEPFRDEAYKLWEVYQRIARPQKITRVAVRYINRLDLPSPLNDLKEYLKTLPEVSPDLPEMALSGYFMQVQIPQIELEGTLILTQTIVPPPPNQPDVVSVLLDIDLFREANLPEAKTACWGILEELHTRADKVFEACITERTKELMR
jgi:uncharacterized protein (TIGR04255 family)